MILLAVSTHEVDKLDEQKNVSAALLTLSGFDKGNWSSGADPYNLVRFLCDMGFTGKIIFNTLRALREISKKLIAPVITRVARSRAIRSELSKLHCIN